ncbi:dihydrofolate reductase family protein [Pseudomonas sp. SP16.1]|uniref:dihydrofolate reductase family protein n=1 Tax=Pseudomonas sp. SP16.1 TaxID=3458854 RepID=UPI0040454A7D
MNPSLIYHITSSLDGYIARPDGRLDWFDSLRQPDEEYSFQYFYSGIDALLMGRGTYEALRGRGGPWPYPGKPCVVLTRLELPRASDEVQLTHCTPGQALAALGEAKFQRIWLVGGSLLAGTCYTAGLIDEVVINLVPHVLGAGIPLLATGMERSLTLSDQRRFNSGTVQLHYRVQKQVSQLRQIPVPRASVA